MANKDEIAAATIPRGATQLKNHLSFEDRLVPIPDTQILNGRAIKIATNKTAKPSKPKSTLRLNLGVLLIK